jgi:hypothetical protein
MVVWRFTGTPTLLINSGNLYLNSNFTPNGPDSTITLVCDGVNWYEISRTLDVGYSFTCPVTIKGDCTTAFLVEKADGTDVFIVNTTSQRVGIRKIPTVPLDVLGNALFEGTFGMNVPTSAAAAWQLQVAGVPAVTLDTSAGLRVLTLGDALALRLELPNARFDDHLLPTDLSSSFDLGADPSNYWRDGWFTRQVKGQTGAFDILSMRSRTDTVASSPQHNYAILSSFRMLVRVSPTVNPVQFTGFAAPVAGTNMPYIDLINVHATNSFVLMNQNVGSTAANRIITGGADDTVQPNDTRRLWYDDTSARWRVLK